MNIYAARKLQKQLYKRSNTPHKAMLCSMVGGELCYHVISGICESKARTIDVDFINAISSSVENEDVVVIMFYHNGRWRGMPDGMYIGEIIKID